jgi:hypothetical protein
LPCLAAADDASPATRSVRKALSDAVYGDLTSALDLGRTRRRPRRRRQTGGQAIVGGEIA